jgi:inner membrane protein
MFASFAGCAPDLDFVPGLLAGDMNLYHQGASHSIVAALLFGVFTLFVVRWLHSSAIQVYVSGTLAYASHLLLDFFCYDGRPPYGQPLLWPFVEGHWIASEPVFSGIRHGVPGDSFVEVMADIFSYPNMMAIGLEAAIIIPVLLVTWLLGKKTAYARGD